MIEGCASGWPVRGQAHKLGRFGEQSEEDEVPVKKNNTETPLANEWEIYDSFVTIREGTKTGPTLLYTRTRHERRGNIKRKRALVKLRGQ